MPPKPSLLIRGVNWLGDAVMTTPALLRLREALPDARITLLTASKLDQLWAGHPAVDEIISFHPQDSIFTVARLLRCRQFDTAIVFPNSFRSALEVWLARIPNRIGIATNGRGFLLTRKISSESQFTMRKRSKSEIHSLISGNVVQANPMPSSAHQLHHYLRLMAAIGVNSSPIAPKIMVSEIERTDFRSKFKFPSDGRPFIGLNVGAEYGPAKRWPIERFIDAAIEIRQKTNCRWILLGGTNDVSLVSSLTAKLGDDSINLAGQTSLRELCVALSLCRVVLTNDTGPMHLAAAVGARVVVPFGSTSPELTAPGLPGDSHHHFLRSAVPCSPCFLRECPIDFRCMYGISVERVVQAVLRASE